MWMDDLLSKLQTLVSPASIPVPYPTDHPLSGQPAGLLVRDGTTYRWEPTPRARAQQSTPLASVVTSHCFDSLASLVAWLTREAAVDKSGFVRRSPVGAEVLVLTEAAPENGTVVTPFPVHSRFKRWAMIPEKMTRDALADFLADNETDLNEPMLATMISTLRTAKTITVDNDEESGRNMTCRLQYGTAKEATTKIPREFSATFPMFSGAWAPGTEPTELALFRLRVIPPRGSELEPTFAVRWVNREAFESQALDRLCADVGTALGPFARVYRGTPNVIVYEEL